MLNAGLFACTTVEELEMLWRNEVGYYTFLMPDVDTVIDFIRIVIKDISSAV